MRGKQASRSKKFLREFMNYWTSGSELPPLQKPNRTLLGFRGTCRIWFSTVNPAATKIFVERNPLLIIFDPGHGEDLHLTGPGLTQNPGALFHRGAGGIEVIDEKYVFALHPARVGDGKSSFDVVLAFIGVEAHLGGVWRVRTSASRATAAPGKPWARNRD